MPLKFCKDCRFFYDDEDLNDICHHKSNIIFDHDLVNSIDQDYESYSCQDIRAYGWLTGRMFNKCGKEGRFFEAKSE